MESIAEESQDDLSVLLVPGAAETSSIWDDVATRLRSSAPGIEVGVASKRAPAEALTCLTRHRARTVVVGHSLGGMLAVQAAQTNSRIAGLVLVATAARMPIANALRDLVRSDPIAGADVVASAATSSSMDNQVRQALRQRFRAMARDAGASMVQADFAAVASESTQWPTDMAPPPTTVIASRDDRLVSWTLSCALALSLSANFVLVDNAGHLLPWTAPDTVTRTVCEIVERCRMED